MKREKVQFGFVFADAKGSMVSLLDRVEGDEWIVLGDAEFVHIKKWF